MVAAASPGPQPDQGPVRGGGREPSPQPRDQRQQQVQQQLQQQGLVPGAASLWYDQRLFIVYGNEQTIFYLCKKIIETRTIKSRKLYRKYVTLERENFFLYH